MPEISKQVDPNSIAICTYPLSPGAAFGGSVVLHQLLEDNGGFQILPVTAKNARALFNQLQNHPPGVLLERTSLRAVRDAYTQFMLQIVITSTTSIKAVHWTENPIKSEAEKAASLFKRLWTTLIVKAGIPHNLYHIAVADQIANALIHVGAPADHVVTFPAIIRDAFLKTELNIDNEKRKRLYNAGPDDFVLISHGRIAPEKNTHTLVRIFSQVAQKKDNGGKITLFIVGEITNKYGQQFIDLANKAHLLEPNASVSINLIDQLPNASLLEYLKQADAFIGFANGYPELRHAWGMNAVEAAAMGLELFMPSANYEEQRPGGRVLGHFYTWPTSVCDTFCNQVSSDILSAAAEQKRTILPDRVKTKNLRREYFTQIFKNDGAGLLHTFING